VPEAPAVDEESVSDMEDVAAALPKLEVVIFESNDVEFVM
jgi:hypothetical protein